MGTSVSREAFFATSVGMDFLRCLSCQWDQSRGRNGPLTCAQADITLVSVDELHGQVIELVEIIAGVGNLPRLIAKPPHRLQDALKVLAFLRLRVRVVVSKVCLTPMMSSVTKIHENGFGMTYVEVSIWFRGESRPNLTASSGKMFLSQIGFDLRITTRFVQSAQEPLFKYGLDRRFLNSFGGGCLWRRFLRILRQRSV